MKNNEVIELYGSPVSNCYNTVLAALRHKGIEHHQKHIGATQDAGFLLKSPMGKIPFILHEGAYISETSVIVAYLDQVFSDKPLFPGSPLEQARCGQLMKIVELYVESPARRLFPGVFWYLHNDPLHVAEVRPVIERGLNAVELLLQQNRFLLGGPKSGAGYYFYFSLGLAETVCQQQYGWDFWEERPLMRELYEQLGKLDFMIEISAQRDGAMEGYLAEKSAEANSD
ncbi:glutathione S-transferase family protein [Spongiibacter sp. KMU-166]|uniref:Glutathione S-transferase family protein n=1 Tax=Spongiibacter thalassae TaxID=2721624 RepID=A0ABX1GCA4_9GAMM|nr:glutathione S-transferase family protein [Spongiibacter thalassae]NKI16576.1 glutathione S-transferase family protein [Spongiibacter thalassae]